MQGNPKKPFNNSEGYTDTTPYFAEKNIAKDERAINIRIGTAVDAIKYMAKLFGFDIKGRIVLVDVKTGKEYR